MLSLEESLKILKETKALIEGHFILSSGLHSPKYVQCAQLMSKPHIANKLCQSLAEKIKKEFEKSLNQEVKLISAATGYQLDQLTNLCLEYLNNE